MSTEPTNPPPDATPDPAPDATWGAPATSAQKDWTGRKTAIAIGVAAVIVAGGGVAIAVGTSNNAQTSQGPGFQRGGNFGGMPGGMAGGMPGGMQGGMGGGTAALRGAIHGDFVVSDGNGGYLTERMQTGDVTAVSATSISLTSKDGYQQGYTIDSSTESSGPKTGDTVTVVAKVSGSIATATSITAGGQVQRGGGLGGPGGQGGQGGPGGLGN
jgi:hypothetical protein